jgi:hypothetical protein
MIASSTAQRFPGAYCQVEMSVWCDQVFLTGGIVTRKPLARDLADIAYSGRT